MSDPEPPIGLPAGTPVLTPAGPVPVETLAPGAMVLAVSGTAAPFQQVVAVDHATLDVALVRIRAGALGDGAPQDDLLLPGGQALLLDGVLIAVGDLVDGLGVMDEPAGPPLVLVRLALAGHDAVLAGGAAVETAHTHPDSPPCAPRCVPDATLRAMLAWRAEVMGWTPPAAPATPMPEVGSFRARLAASAFARIAAAPLPIKPLR